MGGQAAVGQLADLLLGGEFLAIGFKFGQGLLHVLPGKTEFLGVFQKFLGRQTGGFRLPGEGAVPLLRPSQNVANFCWFKSLFATGHCRSLPVLAALRGMSRAVFRRQEGRASRYHPQP